MPPQIPVVAMVVAAVVAVVVAVVADYSLLCQTQVMKSKLCGRETL